MLQKPEPCVALRVVVVAAKEGLGASRPASEAGTAMVTAAPALELFRKARREKLR